MTSGNNQTALLQRATEESVVAWGKTLVLAPHPDDESLGCGGTIALLRHAEIAVEVVFTSDGSMSHPNSKQYPAAQLTALRQMEALAALQVLGVAESKVHFMGLKDSQVPDVNNTSFNQAVASFGLLLQTIQPEVILVPWRRDPHQDHRASWQIVDAALVNYTKEVRRLEYLIWLWERGAANELPTEKEASIRRVNITSVIHQKKEAISRHLSQTTRLIDDDPDGFILSSEVLAHFDRDYELFVEVSAKTFSSL